MGNHRRWGGLVLLLTLVGCTGRLWQENADANGITLHWYTRESTMDVVHAEATEHCSLYGKRAELLREFEGPNMTTANFACVPGPG